MVSTFNKSVSIQPSAVSGQLKINLEQENLIVRDFRALKLRGFAHLSLWATRTLLDVPSAVSR
ncbi:MAG: hypothetical protein F6K56_02170 [Moorea sp. SIO3G5]|nr:hypothetical protein [Moorena sp. SIO3G5]